MKKFKLDNKYFTISMYALMVIVAAILIDRALTDFNIGGIIRVLSNVLSPFIIGLFIAYFLNTPVKFFVKIFPKKLSNDKTRHIIAVILTYILFATAVIWIIAYLLPELLQSITMLFANLPRGLERFRVWLVGYLDVTETEIIEYVYNFLFFQTDIMALVNSIVDPFLKSAAQVPDMVYRVLSGTFDIASSVLNFVIGIMVSFYMLCDKVYFAEQATKIVNALFKNYTAEKIIYAARTSNDYFEKFFIGKAIDSLIIGLIFFAGSLIFRFPYAMLNSLIIGVTNMIPYFGPFIGAVPVTIIVLLTNPIQAIWVVLFIFLLQQFDGIILGPKILGDSTGLKPIWVIFAITVGGYFFGVLGMFLGVPVFAVISLAFTTFINKKLEKNNSEK